MRTHQKLEGGYFLPNSLCSFFSVFDIRKDQNEFFTLYCIYLFILFLEACQENDLGVYHPQLTHQREK